MTSVRLPRVRPVTTRKSEEATIRELVVPRLRAFYPDARIIHEFPLRYSDSRLDLAAVTPDFIAGVEIKSSIDTHVRLAHQLALFRPICHRLVLVLTPGWRGKRGDVYYGKRYCGTESIEQILERLKDGGCRIDDTWWCDPGRGTLGSRHPCEYEHQWSREAADFMWARPYQNISHHRLWAARLLDILHASELRAIAERFNLKPPRTSTHGKLCALVLAELPGKEIVPAVCRALRARDAFGRASDPPVKEEK